MVFLSVKVLLNNIKTLPIRTFMHCRLFRILLLTHYAKKNDVGVSVKLVQYKPEYLSVCLAHSVSLSLSFSVSLFLSLSLSLCLSPSLSLSLALSVSLSLRK
jgi:hypothetical protein